MSHDAMNAVWKSDLAKHSHLVLLLRVADNINDVTGEWALTLAFLAKHARMSPRQAQRVIAQLEKDGWLVCRREPGKAVVYSLGSRVYNPPDVRGAKLSPPTTGEQGGDISGTLEAPTPDSMVSRGGDIKGVVHTVTYPQDLTVKNTTSAEPPAAQAQQAGAPLDGPEAKFEGTGPAAVAIPLVSKVDSVFRVRASLLAGWREAYPAVEANGPGGVCGIERELARIREWNLAHPQNQKTRAGMLKHITGWLAKAQNSASRSEHRVPGTGPAGTVTERNAAAIRRGAGL